MPARIKISSFRASQEPETYSQTNTISFPIIHSFMFVNYRIHQGYICLHVSCTDTICNLPYYVLNVLAKSNWKIISIYRQYSLMKRNCLARMVIYNHTIQLGPIWHHTSRHALNLKCKNARYELALQPMICAVDESQNYRTTNDVL